MKAGLRAARTRPGFPDPALTAGLVKIIAATGLFFLSGLTGSYAQSDVLRHATDFTSDQYFEPPNQQRVKMRLTGTSASPLPGGALDIANLKIETFNLSGQSEAVVHAPECIYAPYDGLASSAGHLELQTADGKIVVTGDGFLWRQSDNSLTISNNVHTVIKMKALQPNLP
jgi:hypothetical protein